MPMRRPELTAFGGRNSAVTRMGRPSLRRCLPSRKGNPLAPYINGELLKTSARAEQYFNPPGNHPSQPNYLWLEANFGTLDDTQPGQVPGIHPGSKHLVRLLQDAGISWMAYAEPDFGSAVYDTCPLDFSFLDVNHLAPPYFKDVNDGLNPLSPECIAHVRPYYQLATDLADRTTAQYNLVIPNLCHDGHEGVSPCDSTEPADNTLRSDTWLKRNVPLILESEAYKESGALIITWDEAEHRAMKNKLRVGNASLKFSALSYPPDFPMASGDNECTSSTSLPAAGTCVLIIDFSPVTAFSSGSSKLLKEAVKFTTNLPKRVQQVSVAGEELR